MESNKQIEDTAAAWIARRDSEEWTLADEAQLGEWLSSSTAHRVAYLRLEAAWEQTLRLQAVGAGTSRGVVPPPGQWQMSPFFEQRQPATESESKPTSWAPKPKLLTLAASLLIVLGISAYIFSLLQGDQYTTPVGGMASIPLQDGSNVTLNTASRIRVVLNEQERLIKLEDGEAFFDVARDTQRLFIVEVGKRRIVAVGTRFSVRRDSEDFQVVVTEGRVRIENAIPDSAIARPSNSDGSAALLAAGAIAHTSNAKLLVEKKTQREAEEALSWRTGYLTFDALPLSAAITEFNRYTPRKIVIRDPEVAALPVSGKFRATNAEAFIRVLREGFGIQVQEVDDAIVLTNSRAEPL